ncbi:MAG: PadR family transcriptional regulator [Deltaproteobacteria bacterium]|nr:PadR family transcriptional regulator [Deltaproteobacteria bacterium]
MAPQSFTEYIILGALMSGAKHGYEIMQFLGSALEAAWRPSTSQLYVLLKRLENTKLIESHTESQETRPSKRVLNLTTAGRETFLEWLNTPVEHVRDFRMEFLGKMFFFDFLSLSGAGDLVEKQIRILEKLAEKIRTRVNNIDKKGFMNLVYGYKLRTVESLLLWLIQEAKPFAVKK